MKGKEVSFSVHSSTAASLRELASEFGSASRAIQVAVELLYALRPKVNADEVGRALAPKADALAVRAAASDNGHARRKHHRLPWECEPGSGHVDSHGVALPE